MNSAELCTCERCERCWLAFAKRFPNLDPSRARAVFEAGAAAIRRALERGDRGRPPAGGDR